VFTKHCSLGPGPPPYSCGSYCNPTDALSDKVYGKAGLLPGVGVGVAIGIGIEKRVKNDSDSDSELHGTTYRLRNRPSSSTCRS
ncbi:MAG: hypothetical protein WC340_03685, partial [Kiritimatiellia bacterium]